MLIQSLIFSEGCFSITPNKQVYAIKLFNGTVHDWAWPNAGVFNLERGGVVELKDVEFVKKGRDDFER